MTSEERRRRYADLSSRLALLDDRELAALIRPAGRRGWGTSGTVALDGADDRVFVKRMPVTDLERTHRNSTRNVHQLPAFYSYGVGSAGFGVARELAVHVKTTGWVLADEIETFPLLLHARVLPRRPHKTDEWSSGPDYVRYWNGSKRIGAYIESRNQATEELCLVLEHVDHTLAPWLAEHQDQAPNALGQLCDTLTFLHERGVLHLDAHFHNVVTDGARVHLTDLGLALDRAFDLSANERHFFDTHEHYDFGEAISNLGAVLVHLLDHGPPADKQRVCDLLDLPETGRRAGPLVRNLERVLDRGLLEVDDALVDLVLRYREVIVWMWTFFGELQHNRRKDTPFDDAHLRRLIDDAGGLPRT